MESKGWIATWPWRAIRGNKLYLVHLWTKFTLIHGSGGAERSPLPAPPDEQREGEKWQEERLPSVVLTCQVADKEKRTNNLSLTFKSRTADCVLCWCILGQVTKVPSPSSSSVQLQAYVFKLAPTEKDLMRWKNRIPIKFKEKAQILPAVRAHKTFSMTQHAKHDFWLKFLIK